jgi:hypothetical protein
VHLSLQLLLLPTWLLPACQVLRRLLPACQLLLQQLQVLAAVATLHAAAGPGC